MELDTTIKSNNIFTLLQVTCFNRGKNNPSFFETPKFDFVLIVCVKVHNSASKDASKNLL